MKVNINSETGLLKTLILGTANDRSKTKHLNNPKYAEIVKAWKSPTETDLIEEVETFHNVLIANNVKVLRPQNIPNHGQIFCRDIGFAIGNNFFIWNMQKINRQVEIKAIEYIINTFDKVYYPPENCFIEGWDIIVWKNYVFVWIWNRSNEWGLNFLKKTLWSDKEIIPFSINATNEGKSNILHLDCAFQPIGLKYAIIYKDWFQNPPNFIYDIWGENNLIQVNQKEMYDMFPNILSINPEKIVIEKSFTRLSKELIKRNIEPIKIKYSEVSKLGGLLRCSCCPIDRQDI